MLKFAKQIRDPVLGWIWLTEDEVKLIDECPFIQRLRYIHQLGLAHLVYPTARHTRFDHSLGVVHLATKMFQSLVEHLSTRGLLDQLLSSLNVKDLGVSYLLRHLRFAALIHDIGHLPFSHSLDNFITCALASKIETSPETQKLLELSDEDVQILKFVSSSLYIAKEHEWITYFLLTRNRDFNRCLREAVPDIDVNLIKDILFVKMFSKIISLDLSVPQVPDIERIRHYSKETLKYMELLSSIISSSLDADRIDYMLRDLYFTGASVSTNISLSDVERILSNVYVHVDYQCQDTIVIAFDEKARACLEGFVIARYNLYKWVYLHHKVTLMTSLMRTLYSRLIDKVEEISVLDLVREHLADLAKFCSGSLPESRALLMTDYHVMSVLTRHRDDIAKLLGPLGKIAIDSILFRRSCFKSLWKRDVEFENAIQQAVAEDITSFNRKIGIIIYESYKNPNLVNSLISVFSKRLINEIRTLLELGLVKEEQISICLSELCREISRDLQSIILIGFAYFEPDVNIYITSSSVEKLVELESVSPLSKSVREAWQRSPKLFIYVNMDVLRRICGEWCEQALQYLRSCIIRALDYSIRDMLNLAKHYM